MTTEQIDHLLTKGIFPEESEKRELLETHISWVILCDRFVYKIKKPVQYSFLNFSNRELRKYYCEQEISLNRRLTKDVYLEVLPIRESLDKISIGGKEGNLIDFVVKMNKVDVNKQMDRLLSRGLVNEKNMKDLAEKISAFHLRTKVIYKKDVLDLREKFNDLAGEKDYLASELGWGYGELMENVLRYSNGFLEKNAGLILNRLHSGYYRDCHGDLHSRNIFLLPEPVPFDCIEFNDDFRQIDVLNEIAFLCMDLDAFGRQDLGKVFWNTYNASFPTMKTQEDFALFLYYKLYRANIRAKINSLRSRSATDKGEISEALLTSKRYLKLMESYWVEMMEMDPI